jgi:gliding motility-associated-like protein
VGSLNTVFVNAGSNVTFCEGGKTTLAAVSNGSSVLWTPSTGLSNPAILNPDASPITTTVYTLTAQTGFCKASSSVTLFVNPAPVANAGRDTAICFGADVQLNGSGGVAYLWSPAAYLSATNIANPFVVKPNAGSITYRVLVTDINGCVSLKDDAVTINISQPAKLFVGNDTVIAINQPLPLHAIDVNNTGFLNYAWSPAYGLSNPFAKDPVAILNRDIQYTVVAQNAFGCTGTDDIKIKVYKGPEIYVPNIFTPDGDGLNDVLKPIIIGMKAFHYFRVFNRYGQMIFATANASNGWDGYFKASKQPFATYIWMAEAVDYLGNTIQRKGTVILLR